MSKFSYRVSADIVSLDDPMWEVSVWVKDWETGCDEQGWRLVHATLARARNFPRTPYNGWRAILKAILS